MWAISIWYGMYGMYGMVSIPPGFWIGINGPPEMIIRSYDPDYTIIGRRITRSGPYGHVGIWHMVIWAYEQTELYAL